MTAAVSAILGLVLAGCASYTTPGGSVPLVELAEPDVGRSATADASGGVAPAQAGGTAINEFLKIQPTARFPARIAVARVQAPGYASQSNSGFGTGRYSVVTTRDVESDESFARMEAMPMVAGFGPLNRILLPVELDSLKALRTAAARLKADILLVYTFDTSFRVGAQHFGPVNVIALGLLPNKEVAVTTTASAAFFDVRTEFLYGLAEASARESRYASVWGSSDAVDELRVTTERKAFEALVPEIEKAWSGIVEEHGSGAAGATVSDRGGVPGPT